MWCGVAAAQPLPWRVCVPDAAFPPYLFNDAKRLGLTEELMVAAGRQAGLAVAFERLPYQRCLALAREGQVQAVVAPEVGAVPAGLELPRKESGAVEAGLQIMRMDIVWLRRRGSPWRWDGQQLHELPELRTVVMRSGVRSGFDKLKALGLQVDQTARDATQMLRMVQSGRAMAAVMMVSEYDGVAQSPEFTEIEQLAQPLQTQTYFAAVSPVAYAERPAQVVAWWRAIGALRDTRAFRPPPRVPG